MVNPSASNDISKSTNTLHLNDESTTSRMTQLDIEHVDETEPAIDEYDDTDLEDLPPLSTYLAGWKFWFQFALWPFVFLLLNGVVVSTLIAFDEYEFVYGKRSSHRYYDIISNEERSNQIPYEMMKYNRTIIAVLLFIDALIIYRAVLFLDRKIRELDMIGDVNHDDDINQFTTPAASPTLKPNVHAQVSRKLDVILGRHPQSRISIFVSILWLLFVGCGTVGLVSVADLLFAVSPKGKKVCIGKHHNPSTSNSSQSYDNNDDFNGSNANNNENTYPDEMNYNDKKHNPIKGIPDELQEWAHTRHDMYSHISNVVHLTNGMNYFTAANPLENITKNEWMFLYGTPFFSQLVSTSVSGNITFYRNVVEPSTFTSIAGDNLLNSSGFCCIYRAIVEQPHSDNDDFAFYPSSDMSILCTKSTDTVIDGVFPNTTLLKSPSNKDRVQASFESASIKSFNEQIYIQVVSSTYNIQNGMFKSLMTFYTVSYDATTLTLNQIAETSDSSQEEFENGPFFIGPGSPCYKWTRNIDVAVFLITLGAASMWLTKIKNLSVGIVPGVVAVSITLSRINHGLSLAVSSLSAVALFFGLLGCVNIPLRREKVIWALYTLLFCVAGLIFTGRFFYYYDSFYNFERALVTIAIASLIGFVLNHPVLYLFGWIGGIWAISCGIFLLFTPPYGGPNYHTGIFAIGLGIVVGSGCATIGFNLTKYRAHVVYYSKRAWFAMNAAIQSNNRDQRMGNQNSTSTTSRYAPVMNSPHAPTVTTHDQEFGGNDITAGLLNQNTEGRTRNH